MKINYLTKQIAWFGKYSGYENLPNYMPPGHDLTFFAERSGFINKLIGKIYQVLYRWRFKRPQEVLAAVRFLSNVQKSEISHFLYLDYESHTLEKITPELNKRLVGTIHIPISRWKPERFKLLPNMSNYIILYKEEIEEFKKYAPNSTFHVIPHGVDVDFFKPLDKPSYKKNKILQVGHYLRNFEMFGNVYEALAETTQGLEFHFLIPKHHRNDPHLNKIAGNRNVFFHEKLTDEEMLALYQDSYLMLMPMGDSGANTAIVQALGVGLPIITTDNGGIRSYGGGDVFEVVPNHDTQAMVDLFMRFYNDQAYRDEISRAQRQFALNELDWRLIAKKHLDVYQQILKK